MTSLQCVYVRQRASGTTTSSGVVKHARRAKFGKGCALKIVTRSIVVIHKDTGIHLRSPTPPLSPHLQHYRFDFFNFRSAVVCVGGSVVVGGLLYAFTFTDNI